MKITEIYWTFFRKEVCYNINIGHVFKNTIEIIPYLVNNFIWESKIEDCFMHNSCEYNKYLLVKLSVNQDSLYFYKVEKLLEADKIAILL